MPHARISAAPPSQPQRMASAIPIAPEDDDGTEAEEVDDADLAAADEGDLTEQAPPVTEAAGRPADLYADLDADGSVDVDVDISIEIPAPSPMPAVVAAAPRPQVFAHAPAPEKAPLPSPSPANVPAPQPIAPKMPSPSQQPREKIAPQRIPPEHAPAPSPSPEVPQRVSALDPDMRHGALERLRARAKKLTQLGSFYPPGERTSGVSASSPGEPQGLHAVSGEVGSFAQGNDKR